MHIDLIAVGKLKEKYLMAGVDEYRKRLRPYAKIQIVEVADEKAPEAMSDLQAKRVKEMEGERILRHIRPEAHVIVLDLQGKAWSSDQFAAHIEDKMTYGCHRLDFVIGGSLGLSEDVLKRADVRLSFGQMTYPHPLMRLILTEQIYRAFKIMRREPYHK